MKKKIILLIACLTASLTYAQQNFSCYGGTRAACLSYSEKLVDSNAQCFDSGTCGYKGFVCKSKLDDVIEEYEKLVRANNDLQLNFHEILTIAQDTVNKKIQWENEKVALNDRYEALAKDYINQTIELRRLTNSYNQLLALQRVKK